LRRRITCSFAALAVVAALAPVGAGPAAAQGEKASRGGSVYVPDYVRANKGPAIPGTGRSAARTTSPALAGAAKVGDKRLWPALDDAGEFPIYYKEFRYRARSEHAEVWTAAGRDDVSHGLFYPEGDCRNADPARIKITKDQIRYFLRQFERKIYPRETRWFSTPPKRNGTDASRAYSEYLRVNVPKDNFVGKGRRIVILIDNVRDANFFDRDNANTLSRIAGFHWAVFNEETDRNVMSIDSFNWLANTTKNPPHSPSEDPCLNFPAGPYSYEGVFAHEFQHLLEYYADPDGETAWLDEALADWAQTLTGYVRPWAPLSDPFYDSHIQCFLGYLEQRSDYNPIPAENCGPENSLTLWRDQEDNEIEILADYGAAYSFIEMIEDRYGKDAMRFLHRDNANGFESMTRLLAHEGATQSPLELVHDWLVTVAVDSWLDSGATLHARVGADYEVETLNASIDWDNDDAYMTPGAPPNGADYVLARTSNQQPLGADEITSISFDGADVLPAEPVEWQVDSNPPTDAKTDQALFTGEPAPNLDRAIVREVRVPATNATLTFDTYYDIEGGYDYGFVQVSTNGGETWTSLANADTHSAIAGDAPLREFLEANVPGFTGTSGGGAEPVWVNETFDLSTYAGQTVLLSFRYVTDPGVEGAGWWIDNVTLGEARIADGTSVGGWRSLTEVNPVDVEGFTVQLVAWTSDTTEVWVAQLPLGPGHAATLGGRALADAIGTTAENVGIIVTYDDPTETATQYAPYELEVNGITQNGST